MISKSLQSAQNERLYCNLKWYEDKCKIRCVLLCMVFVFLNKLVSWPWPSQHVLNMKSCADDLSTLINSPGDLGFDDSPIHQSLLLQLGTVQFWAASAMIQCLVKDADTNGIKCSSFDGQDSFISSLVVVERRRTFCEKPRIARIAWAEIIFKIRFYLDHPSKAKLKQ